MQRWMHATRNIAEQQRHEVLDGDDANRCPELIDGDSHVVGPGQKNGKQLDAS